MEYGAPLPILPSADNRNRRCKICQFSIFLCVDRRHRRQCVHTHTANNRKYSDIVDTQLSPLSMSDIVGYVQNHIATKISNYTVGW